MTGTHSSLPADLSDTFLKGASFESPVQAAGAFDGSVLMKACQVFRTISTAHTGGLGPVKQTVPLNKSHVFQLG
jgi:hypothetical protein